MTFSLQIPGINIVAISGRIEGALRLADKRKGSTAEFTLSSSPRASSPRASSPRTKSADASHDLGSVANLNVRVLLTDSLSQRIASHLNLGAAAIVEGELTGVKSRYKRGNQFAEVGIIAKRIHLYGKDGRMFEFDADQPSAIESPKPSETAIAATEPSGVRSSIDSQKSPSNRSTVRKPYSRKAPLSRGRSDRNEKTSNERRPRTTGTRGKALVSDSGKPERQSRKTIKKPVSPRGKANKGTSSKSPFEIEQTTENFDPFLTETSSK